MDLNSPYSGLMLPARYKIVGGGRDSAKSWSIAEALVRLSLIDPALTLCTREYQNSIKDSVHRLLSNTIHRLGLAKWFTITDKVIRNYLGGEFIFKGLRYDVQEIKSTEGIKRAWVEEGQHTSEDSWQTLIPTVRAEDSEIWCSFNVIDEVAPTYRRFFTEFDPAVPDAPTALIKIVNFDQNPHLSETSKKEIAYLKRTDYEAYEHIYLGKAKKISESIIFGGRCRVEQFSDELWKEADRVFIGSDHGFANDPAAVVRSFVLKNKLYIEYEAFGVGVEFAGKKVLAADGHEMGELEALYDSVPGARQWPIKSDSSRPETISFIKGCSFNISAADKWEGCVEDGITHIKGFDEIIIHERCKHMQQEARLYAYKKDRITGEVLPVIIDKHNHGWDSVRYSLDGYIQRRGKLAKWAKL